MMHRRARHTEEPPDRLRVLFPPADDRNSYLRNLAGALRDEGVDARFGPAVRFFRLWRAVVRCGRPDVIHLQWQHGYFTATNPIYAVGITLLFFIQWLTLRLSGIRFVWTVHNLVNHERRQAGWELRCSRLLARVVDAVVVHCDAAAVAVAQAYGIPRGAVSVVPHGRYRRSEERNKPEARQSLGIDEAARVLLAFGTIRRYKGLGRLIDAFADTPADAARLIVVGRPASESLASELRRRAAADPRVTLRLDHVSDDVLSDHIIAADLVVLPYRRVLTSGAAIMAASHGRAVLAPRLGCLADLPDGGTLHYIYGESGGLGAALRRAVALSADRVDRMGRAALEYAEARPWSLAVSRLRRIYATVTPCSPRDEMSPARSERGNHT